MVEPGIRVLPATASPWVWSGWAGWWRRELRDRAPRRRARLRIDLPPDWRREPGLAPPEITHAFYTPNQIRHIINFSKWQAAGVGSPGAVTPPPGWPRDLSRNWRPWPDVTHIKLEPRASVAPARASPGPAGWWEGAGRGLPLGAALLAAILLLLRVADRCLHTNLFKLPMRRQQSEEWPTPNVMATSLAVRMTSDIGSMRPPSPSTAHCTEQADLPPPYSECAADASPAPAAAGKPEHEEPPPPYSACYVAYSNPKDGPPSVHFFTRQCQNLFANYEAGPSNLDTGQTALQDIDPTSDEEARICFENCTAIEDTDVSDEDRVEVALSNVAHHENTDNGSEEVKNGTSVPRDRFVVA